MGRLGRRTRRALIAVPVIVICLLLLAQLLLPRIAEDRISSRVGRYGHVESVSVSAWPAVELLWGDADSVTVHASALRITPAQAADLISQADGISRLDAHVDEVHLGKLRLTRARLTKRDSALHGEGIATGADVAVALPAGVGVSLVGSGGGRVAVHVTGNLFGVGAGLEAVAQGSGGRLVVHPTGLLLGALHLTLFAAPQIAVLGVEAHALPTTPPSYLLGISARLR
jgi:hypothetical protein